MNRTMEKKKRTTVLKSLLLTIAVLIAAGLFTVTASAASFRQVTDKKVKTGKYYVWTELNMNTYQKSLYFSKTSKGSKTKVATDTGIALTDGSSIYFGYQTSKNKKDNLTIYKYSMAQKKKSKVVSFNIWGTLEGINNNELIISQNNRNLKSKKYAFDIFSYNLKTKKKKVVSHICPHMEYNNRYIVGVLRKQPDGPGSSGPLYIYDIRKNKNILVKKSAQIIASSDEDYNNGLVHFYADGQWSPSWSLNLKKMTISRYGSPERPVL